MNLYPTNQQLKRFKFNEAGEFIHTNRNPTSANNLLFILSSTPSVVQIKLNLTVADTFMHVVPYKHCILLSETLIVSGPLLYVFIPGLYLR
jgi:hypothetical protein